MAGLTRARCDFNCQAVVWNAKMEVVGAATSEVWNIRLVIEA